MNRRHFAALLPALAATLPALAEAPLPAPMEPGPAIESGIYPGKTPPEDFKGRFGHSYIHGMLPTGIGCEVHVSSLQPGTPHETAEKHKHSEIWLVREGKVELMLNGETHMLAPGDVGIAVAGTMHWVRNAGDTVCSYYVMEVGTGPITH
jgi:mannose-6-phosphate isomerase-like protein (cupin superfamily)